MYKLNDVEISDEKLIEIIDDLAAFPYDQSDLSIPLPSRKEKYLKTLKESKSLRISKTLTIHAIDH